MKMRIGLVLLLALQLVFSSFLTEKEEDHPFHMSITELAYNKQDKLLEVAVKIFTDDLEEVLKKQYNSGVLQLTTPEESMQADALIYEYLKNVFQLEVNGRLAKADFLGKEGDLDAVWVYFEYPVNEEVKSLSLKNEVLLDLFEDQQNVVYFTFEKKKETYICLKDNVYHNILK